MEETEEEILPAASGPERTPSRRQNAGHRCQRDDLVNLFVSEDQPIESAYNQARIQTSSRSKQCSRFRRNLS